MEHNFRLIHNRFLDAGFGNVDLIVTDPPFGVDFADSKFYDDSARYVDDSIDFWIQKMAIHLKDGGHCYIFVPTKRIDLWIMYVREFLTFNNLITVKKYSNALYVKNNYHFDTQHIIFCSKGKADNLRKVDWIPTSNYWLNDNRNPHPEPYTYRYPNFINMISNCHNSRKRHPNQKNVDLIKKLIEISSDKGDIVLDPFMGYGTTGVAAKLCSRKFIGIDINEKWVELSKKRIENCKVSKDGFEF